MKNVLFATSALVSLAGVAYAEGVALSGSAEMGVTYLDDGVESTTVFHNDIDVTFTLSGQTDNGSLTFGATIDLDEVNDGDNEGTENSVFVSGAFGTLSMGDVDGAYDKVHIELPNGGLSDEADQASGGNPLDGLAPEIARYDYSFGSIGFSASIGLKDQANINDQNGAVSNAQLDDNVYELGLSYSGDFGGTSVKVGLGASTTSTVGGSLGDGDHTAIGVSAELGFGSFGFNGTYQSIDRPSDALGDALTDEIYGVGATYSTGAIGFGIAYEHSETGTGVGTDVIQGYVTYDLTGGAELVAAASSVDTDGADTETRAGFGIGLSF